MAIGLVFLQIYNKHVKIYKSYAYCQLSLLPCLQGPHIGKVSFEI